MGADFDGKSTRRAPRYPISVPVRFRAAEGDWVDGTTVNLCAHGMLIRTGLAPVLSTRLQLQFGLTGDLSSGPQVKCSGRVVRTEQPEDEAAVLVAVTIDDFQLRPASQASLAESRR